VIRGEEEGRQEVGEEEGSQEEGQGRPRARERGLGGRGLAGLSLIRSLGATRVLVEFSGGKDSWAVLGLALDSGVEVEAVHYHLVRGMDCEEVHLRAAEARGVRVHRLPHPELGAALASGHHRPHVSEWGVLSRFRHNEARDAARAVSGLEWILTGMRASDSLSRRGMFKRWGGVWAHSMLGHPIWSWSTAEVLRFLRLRRLPCPKTIGGKRTGGVSLSDESVLWLHDECPQDYARLLRVFPWAASIPKRHGR